MSNSIEKYAPFVKEQIDYNDRTAHKFRGDEKRAQAYLNRAAVFRQMLVELESPQLSGETASYSEASFRLSQEEIRDLPPELISQLSLTEADKKEFLIAEIIDDLGGATSLDKILIAIFRRTNEVEKRIRLNARIYRMANKGMVFAHPSRKGIYGTKPFPKEMDQSALFIDDEVLDPEE